LKLGPALTLSQNPIFEMASTDPDTFAGWLMALIIDISPGSFKTTIPHETQQLASKETFFSRIKWHSFLAQ
jgi:hypothetical protein